MNASTRSIRILTALLVAAGAPSLAHAQQAPAGPRWLGLLGCWGIAQAGTAKDGQLDGRIVCITPTPDANVAEISAIADGRVQTTDKVDASGRSYPMTVTGCTGTQSANWSADQRRLFLKSSVTCDGVTKEMSALLSLTLGGEWIDVRRVWSGHPDSSAIFVARYHDVGLPRDVPASVANKLREYAMSIETGRIAASVPVGAPAIIDASKRADSTIVARWLTESGQRFALDQREWRELADAGVSAEVRDAMDETEHPSASRDGRHFGEYGRWSQQASAKWNQGTGDRVVFPKAPGYVVFYDPWGYGVGYGGWVGGLRYGFLEGLPYGLGYGYGLGTRDVLGLDDALGYLFGFRKSTVGYVRPNVLVLKDNATDGSGPVATPEPVNGDKGAKSIADDIVAAAVKKASGSSTAQAPGSSQAPKGGSSHPQR